MKINKMPLVEVEYRGQSYSLEDKHHLDPDTLTEQLWWIVKQEPENEQEFQEYYYQSMVWYHQTYDQCQYPAAVQDRFRVKHERLYR